ncbi:MULTISPECIES: alpha/beta fold hydrolase [unclassified Roseitalea]|uniref:alpha/beta hydrolase family protein n=1 Tax=unclassified Roseitalea TaxID=2639107 RepID=UPI00273F588B|nr:MULTISPECIES: alpha/beta fold hydrolase [unclassified Roseitalea]
MPAIDRERVRHLLGVGGGTQAAGTLDIVSATAEDGFVRHAVALAIDDRAIAGTLLLPEDTKRPVPAVLYCHAHGNRHDIGAAELMDGRPALQSPYGPALARRGHAVLCIDMPGFGTRQAEGPESALAKAAHWRGRTLFGQMLDDLTAALDALATHPAVDPTRIATLGLSMGATHAYWLAALDERIAACAHLCAFSNIGPLIAAGAHDLHGPYMTVPGLLAHGDMADIAALIAPRPQMVAAGLKDPLTPPEALNPALSRLRQAYDSQGVSDALTVLTSPDTGHEETPRLRMAVLGFLERHLSGASASSFEARQSSPSS